MKKYIHELADWPRFTYDPEAFYELLAQVSKRQGLLLGRMAGIGFQAREDAIVQVLTEDAIESSAIEGEHLDRESVRSSVVRQLGIDTISMSRSTRDADGIVSVLLDASRNYDKPLTAKRIFQWHEELFPKGYISLGGKEKVGAWREGPIHVVSGNYGDPKVHFVGPSPELVPEEMRKFMDWFNGDIAINPLIKAAIAHLWFVTIHPLSDGNGRIARAIADLSLARADGMNQRFYSLSKRIHQDRSEYYRMLERTQQGTLDITRWIIWHLRCLESALDDSESLLEKTLYRDRFWRKHADTDFNDRQKKIINLLIQGFEGNLTSTKWAKITKTSPPTAWRDIKELIDFEILRAVGTGSRNTHYVLTPFDSDQ